jgi:hypothetical protein
MSEMVQMKWPINDVMTLQQLKNKLRKQQKRNAQKQQMKKFFWRNTIF